MASPHPKLLPIIPDSFITVIVGGAGIVGFWRGSWEILDVYLSPDDFNKSVALSWCIGSAYVMFWFCFQNQIHNLVKRYAGAGLLRGILERMATYSLAWGCVLLWRGIWYALDIWLLEPKFAGMTREQGGWTSHCLGVAVLYLLMVGRCLFAPPAGIFWDDARGGFVLGGWSEAMAGRASERALLWPPKDPGAGAGTGDNLKNGPGTVLSLPTAIDAFFSVNVVGLAVVAYWRGSWELLDNYVYPSDFEKSAWVTYAFGALGLISYYNIQLYVDRFFKTASFSATGSSATRWAIYRAVGERLVTYIVAAFVVCIWRGFWYLCDVYLTFPEYGGMSLGPSAWVTHAGGTALLMMMCSFRSALAPPAGIFYDDTDSGFLFSPWSVALAERRTDSDILAASARGDDVGPRGDLKPVDEEYAATEMGESKIGPAPVSDPQHHHDAHFVEQQQMRQSHGRRPHPPDLRRASRIMLDIADDKIAEIFAGTAANDGSTYNGRASRRRSVAHGTAGGTNNRSAATAGIELGESRRGTY